MGKFTLTMDEFVYLIFRREADKNAATFLRIYYSEPLARKKLTQLVEAYKSMGRDSWTKNDAMILVEVPAEFADKFELEDDVISYKLPKIYSMVGGPHNFHLIDIKKLGD